MVKFAYCCLFVSCFVVSSVLCAEPNPPKWPTNVYVFDPATPGTTQSVVDTVFATNGGNSPPCNGQWSSQRYALMFLPGTHTVNVNVGYYTSVIGLGTTPQATTIQSVKCQNGDFDYAVGALNNFWRSVENFATQNYMLWAVSQASPMRRVVVSGDLDLYQYNYGCCAGYASGGFMADSIVSGKITSGSQQQWLSRNVNVGTWDGGVWNMVFVGASGGIPAEHCGTPNPYTVVTATPVIAEKPFISYSGGKFNLMVPRVEFNKVGASTDYAAATSYPFENVYVASAVDTAALINSKLASGLHVVLGPGIYNLTEPIVITKSNTVLLGIGFPTLVSTTGQACVQVAAGVDGVRIAGLLVQAGKTNAPVLVRIGDSASHYNGSSTNPTFIYDIFVRVGGDNDPFAYQVSADTMLEVASGNVVLDNAWLWRADHYVGGGLVFSSMNPCQHSLVVSADDVTAYGLFAEHTLQDMVVWNGERGRTYFFQSEFPYDVTQANYGTPGYTAYHVGSNVKQHSAWGAGVYSYFRDYSVTVQSGIIAPTSATLKNSLTVFLNGYGAINHVVNDKGNAVYAIGMQSYLCSNS